MFIQRVVEALNTVGIQYALVGGYAVALHGAIRGTVDIDIVITLDKDSFEKCERALQNIGLKSRLPVTANDVFNFREEYIKNRNMVAWSFINLQNPLEIVDILITEDAKNIKSISKQVFGTLIKVASIPDIIAMKKKSDRPQDIEDIKALERLL